MNFSSQTCDFYLGIQVFGLGPPLVLFHGFGFDSSIWQELIQPLKMHYQIYLVDLPGFGLSHPVNWSWFKTELLMRLPDKFNVLGWSLGGLYATRLALETPHRVLKLMNLCSSPYFIAGEKWPGIKNHEFEIFSKQLIEKPEESLRAFRAKEMHACQAIPQDFGRIPTVSVLAENLKILGTWDFRAQLSHLNIPMAYLFAGMDSIIPMTLFYEFNKRYPEIFSYILEDATHLLFLSHQNQFIDLLRKFIY